MFQYRFKIFITILHISHFNFKFSSNSKLFQISQQRHITPSLHFQLQYIQCSHSHFPSPSSLQIFPQYVEEAAAQIEKFERALKPSGVLPFIPSFAVLASKMETLGRGGKREVIDEAYNRLVRHPHLHIHTQISRVRVRD